MQRLIGVRVLLHNTLVVQKQGDIAPGRRLVEHEGAVNLALVFGIVPKMRNHVIVKVLVELVGVVVFGTDV